jgi:Mg2+/Co2+ transporter CorB
LSGFFSSSETGMMSINRYRLKHLAKSNHKGAKRVLQLLSRPDKLIGLILIGNNFVNNLAASLTTILAFRYFGYLGDALATTLGTIILTLVVLIFAEVTPKTWAALYPEKIAYPASFILKPLMYLLHPVVWMLNLITNGLLRILGIDTSENSADHITTEELRTIVIEAGAMVPKRHQSMLLSILDLEKVTVNDIMVPRHEIYGIDLDDSDEEINEILNNCQHTRLMVYQGSIDNILGSLHARDALRAEQKTPEPVKQMIRENLRAIHYIPSQTPLNIQMKNFQRKKQRIGLVVNEYGDIQGLVTLEDILEEIVGEFTTDYAMMSKDIHPMDDGSNLIEGTATIRDINRSLGYQLPTDGPKTLNGLVIEYLEAIPPSGSGLKISGHPMEIVQVTDSMIKNVKVFPKQAPKQKPKS